MFCFNFFWKNGSWPLSVSSPISFSFFVPFKWFKTSRVHQPRLFYSIGKDARIKDFKLEVLIRFNSPITKNWTLLHQTPSYLPHSYTESINFAVFAMLEVLGRGLQMFFELQKQRNNVSGFNLFWVLKCSLTSLSNPMCWKSKKFTNINLHLPLYYW
jgi:hypothetical protein